MDEGVHIEETTMGYVPGVSVGVANIFVRDYMDAEGKPGRGPTALLALRPDDDGAPESEVRVYAGMRVELAGRDYRVETVALEGEGSDNGFVVLAPLG